MLHATNVTTPHAEPPGARPSFLAPLFKFASRLSPASIVTHSILRAPGRHEEALYDFRHGPAETLFGTQEPHRPLTFPRAAKPHAKDLHSPVFPAKGEEAHPLPNSTCIPSLGTPIIKAFEALPGCGKRISAQPLASQNTTAACDPSNPRCLGARRRESHRLVLSRLIKREGRSSGALLFSLPL
jgi:hypothetical protein